LTIEENSFYFSIIMAALDECDTAALNEYLSSLKDVCFEFKSNPLSQMNLLAESSLEEIKTLVAEERRKCQAEETHENVRGFEKAMEVMDLIEDVVDKWMNVQAGWIRCHYFLTTEKMKIRLAKFSQDFTIAEENYREIVGKCLENPKISTFCLSTGLLSELNHLKQVFETIGLECENDLMQARLKFPRFFFVSNDQLIEILSVRDIKQLKSHLRFLFNAVHDLVWDEQLNALGMLSCESEYVPWPKPLLWSDSDIFTELWLSDIEANMYKAVWDHIKKARRTYPECDRKQWAVSWPCMIVLCVSQLYWASEAEQAISDGRGRGLLDFNKKCNRQLEEITVMLRGTLSDLERRSIGTMIITEVHARDLCRQLVEDSVTSVSEFAWLAQLRYSWEAENIYCSLLCARRKYGYEYLGVESRIHATPLTDRCYRTLMCALHSNLGGSLEGPAGTGKLETVKGLSQAIAQNICVFNCSDGIDFLITAKCFTGIVCCGSWICFDEFNRMNIEVLTIVAQQILCIQSALKSQRSEIDFEGNRLLLNPACAIFFTMNPVNCFFPFDYHL
jgi:dynein heavy chain, axonemal